ncbi:LysR family transcriptional regulator [Brevibacillus sp. SYP-B805]|uniref:LysR family transcriptional regulator n=1 Tax=Brevibacillus sp. SYP-B805 TaxID=1578199 RepID=UPI0013E9AE18|nr:LysR family transcriptional regulator [Brevibacillus sp. SYP-B805]NGQ96984.1 LysR family transcriptional regulator [Brevibacillus sp. SYP-B805]
MTLTQLQVLVAVAEEKSFTRAAVALGFTQSAVSQMINNLEKELGISLFHRSRGGISPTRIGERMIQHAREILRITSCMREEASASLGLEAGTLRIGAIPSVSAKVLPGLIGSFRKLFPQIEIVLFEGGYEEIQSWLSGSVVDVGFTTMPGKELHAFPLLQDQMLVFVPDDHPLKDEPFLTFDQIKDKCFIMAKDGCFKKLLQEHGIVPNTTFEVSDPATILSMVQEWVGVTILPELYVPKVLPKVTAIPLRPAIRRELVLAVRDCQCVSPVAAEFIVHSQNYVKRVESFR